MLKRWRLIHSQDNRFPLPDSKIIERAIFENNTFATAWRDVVTGDIIIECENKPGNLYVWGIRFEPIKDDYV